MLCVAAVWGGAGSAWAVEPYQDFLNGLRDRGYHDAALLYLEQLEGRAEVPPEVRQVIPYEKAITLLQNAKTLRSPQAQNEQLDRAEGYLDEFLRNSPNHPLAAEANTERARILLGKARVNIWQAKSPANTGKEAEYRQTARDYVAQARKLFQAAHDKYKATWEKFPVHIDESDKKQRAARQEAEINYIRAQLDLALCTYEQAQTYPPEDDQYKKLLTDASFEFEKIHQKYRSQVGGLYARMWQGKCFEEQDDIRRALGIYNELLQHPGTSQVMQRLQDQVRHFRLICLNHEKKQDYQLVIDEATEWLNGNRLRARTKVGLGIRWERALAYETLAGKRTLTDSERERDLQLALNDAQEINRQPGEYRDVSHFMIQRLKAALGKKGQDPTDFDGAFGLGRNLVDKIKTFNNQIAAEKDKAKADRLRTDLDLHLQETGRILRLALELADADNDVLQVNRARFYLAYVYYLRKYSYEAAVLGEFVGKNYQQDDPTTALDAAYLAMAAYVQAYNQAPEDQRDFEVNQMVRVCNLITSAWPESDRANDARMTLGRIYDRKKKPVEAAHWYSQVPESAPQFAAAQLAAGQAYWTAYLESAPLPEAEKPPLETLQQWQQAAEKHLRTGIEKRSQTVPEQGPITDERSELIAGKVSLAQVLVNKGDYDGAVKLLTAPPHAVFEAVAVKDESKRPEKGITSREFASLAYQLLLRAYVGTQQIEQALQAMDRLEKIAGGAQSEDVTAVYVQLGREIEKEMKRLIGLNQPQRLAEVRASFDTFLGELFKRKEQMKYSSLIWIAETYYSLGEGLESSNPAQADAYFEKAAATYQDILARDQADDSFVRPEQEPGVKLRLVNCRRRQGEYEQALELVQSVLMASPRALDAQVEAAYVLQSWAESGRGDSYKQFLTAINGLAPEKEQAGTEEKAGVIWGWAQIAKRLQLLLSTGQAKSDQYRGKLLEARYNISNCRRQYALAQSSDAKRTQGLLGAKQEIEAFVRIAGDVSGVEMSDHQTKQNVSARDEFDRLYRQIQTDLGQTPVPLEWPEVLVAQSSPQTGGPQTADVTPKVVKSAGVRTRAAASPSGTNWLVMIVALLVAAGLAGAFVYFTMVAPRPRHRYAAASAASRTGSQVSQKARRPGGTGSASGTRKSASGTSGGTETSSPPLGRSAASKTGGSEPATRPAGSPKPRKPRPSN